MHEMSPEYAEYQGYALRAGDSSACLKRASEPKGRASFDATPSYERLPKPLRGSSGGENETGREFVAGRGREWGEQEWSGRGMEGWRRT